MPDAGIPSTPTSVQSPTAPLTAVEMAIVGVFQGIRGAFHYANGSTGGRW